MVATDIIALAAPLYHTAGIPWILYYPVDSDMGETASIQFWYAS